MRDFSVRQMRREYGGVLKNCLACAVLWLLGGASTGAMAVARHADEKSLLLITGVCLVPPLLCLGLYLIFSDFKWLVKKTPFGQALKTLGDPKGVSEEIDQSALNQYVDCGGFILLKSFLIVKYVSGWRLDPRRVCARPFRKAGIQAAHLIPDQNKDDPEKRHIQISVKGEPYDFYCWQQQDWEALKEWLTEGERAGS